MHDSERLDTSCPPIHIVVQDNACTPDVHLERLDQERKGHKGLGVSADLSLVEGQCVWFILRTPPVGGLVDHDTIVANGIMPPRSLDDPFISKVNICEKTFRSCRSDSYRNSSMDCCM